MNRNFKFTLILLATIFIIFAAGIVSNKTKAQEQSKFVFGELVKIKDFPDSETFKVVGNCYDLHEPNYIYNPYFIRVAIGYRNIHLLNSTGQEITIAEFNLEKLK